MNYTREPIIETVITPREGCKLVVRNSKGNGQEDYFVDAVEVVSFGHSFFFRSQERPKAFLVPVSDYEILELKETRMVLKNVSTDRSIKIGGGREAPPRPPREPREEEPVSQEAQPNQEQQQRPQHDRSQMDRKRDKRRRGRRGRDRHDQDMRDRPLPAQPPEEGRSQEGSFEPQENAPAPRFEGEEVKAPSFISKLFPPPPTLIKDNLSRYKPAEDTSSQAGDTQQKPPYDESLFEHEEDHRAPKANDSDDEGGSEE